MRLWDLGTRQPLGEPLRGNEIDDLDTLLFPALGQEDPQGVWSEQSVFDVAFSPDGETLAMGVSIQDPVLSSGSDEVRSHEVRLWDLETRQPLGEPLRGHENLVNGVAFSPDGTTLASASGDNTVRLWYAPASWALGACRVANRNLSRPEWNQFVGADYSYIRTCPALPSGIGAPSDAPRAQYPTGSAWLTSR